MERTSTSHAARSEDDADRRPIRARSSGWARALSTFLVRRRVAPNAISVAGMVVAVLSGGALFATSRVPDLERLLFVAAAVGIELRLLANLLDGMVAIEGGTASPVGELYNEAPDRVSDVAVLVGAGYAVGGSPTLGYVAALAALGAAYVRALARTAGAPNDFVGPFAKPQRMVAIVVACLVFAAFPDAARIAWGPDGAWGGMAVALLVVAAGTAFTLLRRLARAARALRKGGA